MDFKDYFYQKIRDKIGLQGLLALIGYSYVYVSTAKSMARFGILNLNNGIWDNKTIIRNAIFINDMKNSTQAPNPLYGYL